MKKISFYLMSSCFFLLLTTSCSKDDSTLLTEEALYDTELSSRAGPSKDYGEFVCVTDDNKAGKLCKDQINGSCKEAKNCYPVEDIADGILLTMFTPAQLSNFDNVDVSNNYQYHLVMYEAGWYKSHPDDLGIENPED